MRARLFLLKGDVWRRGEVLTFGAVNHAADIHVKGKPAGGLPGGAFGR
jgi:hypothetical protein